MAWRLINYAQGQLYLYLYVLLPLAAEALTQC
jgi:hypothetical protein